MNQFQKALALGSLFFLSLTTAYSQVKVIGNPKSIVYDISFSKGGGWLAATEEKSVNLFDTQSGKLIRSFQDGHTGQVLSVAVSDDSTKLASGGKDGLLLIWDVQTGEVLEKLAHHQGVITSVKFHPQRNLLISAGSDNKITVYDYQKRQVLFELAKHTDDVNAIAVSPDGNILASAGADKIIRLWGLNTGKLLTELPEDSAWIRALSFTQEGNVLLAAGDDRKISRWQIESNNYGYKVDDSTISTGWLLSLDTRGDTYETEVIASSGMDGKIRIRTPFGKYTYGVNRPVHKVLLKPGNELYLKVAVASRGKGILLIDATEMKMKEI